MANKIDFNIVLDSLDAEYSFVNDMVFAEDGYRPVKAGNSEPRSTFLFGNVRVNMTYRETAIFSRWLTTDYNENSVVVEEIPDNWFDNDVTTELYIMLNSAKKGEWVTFDHYPFRAVSEDTFDSTSKVRVFFDETTEEWKASSSFFVHQIIDEHKRKSRFKVYYDNDEHFVFINGKRIPAIGEALSKRTLPMRIVYVDRDLAYVKVR